MLLSKARLRLIDSEPQIIDHSIIKNTCNATNKASSRIEIAMRTPSNPVVFTKLSILNERR